MDMFDEVPHVIYDESEELTHVAGEDTGKFRVVVFNMGPLRANIIDPRGDFYAPVTEMAEQAALVLFYRYEERDNDTSRSNRWAIYRNDQGGLVFGASLDFENTPNFLSKVVRSGQENYQHLILSRGVTSGEHNDIGGTQAGLDGDDIGEEDAREREVE